MVCRPSEQRLGRRRRPRGARRDPRVEEKRQEPGDDQRQQAVDRSARDVALRVVRLLRRERQLLDGEVEPDRERKRVEDPRNAVGEPAAAGVDRIGLEVELRDRADKKTARTASAAMQMNTEKRNVAATPKTFRPTKIA